LTAFFNSLIGSRRHYRSPRPKAADSIFGFCRPAGFFMSSVKIPTRGHFHVHWIAWVGQADLNDRPTARPITLSRNLSTSRTDAARQWLGSSPIKPPCSSGKVGPNPGFVRFGESSKVLVI
jgi:hypothetical protein